MPKYGTVSQVLLQLVVAENTHDKYRKNNKFKKNQYLETEEAKKDPEMSANIAEIAKVTRIFLVS